MPESTLQLSNETSEVARVRVVFEGGGTSLIRSDDQLETARRIRVGGLAPNTTYAITISATDAFDNGPALSAPLRNHRCGN